MKASAVSRGLADDTESAAALSSGDEEELELELEEDGDRGV